MRADQPPMALHSARALPGRPRGAGQVRMEELDAYLVAAIDMFIGEVGIDPRMGDGGRSYRRRVAGLIAAGRAWARFERGEVVFKAEVGSQSPTVGQIQGVWVHLSGAAAASARPVPRRSGRRVLRGGRTASLYVNGFNEVARATYAKIGFTQVGTFADRPAGLNLGAITVPSRCASDAPGRHTP